MSPFPIICRSPDVMATASETTTTTYLDRAKKITRTDGREGTPPPPNIAAIDFGSSSVSLAYSINSKRDIHALPLHRAYERVPNAILIRKEDDGSHTVVQFGLEALERYSRMREEERKNMIYFDRIKLLLEKSDSLIRDTPVESLNGEKYYLVQVIAFIIKYLKDRLLLTLPVANGEPQFKSTDFDWVITVPAIWKARAKRMMREAAYMAGLTSDNPGITKFTPFGNAVTRPPETNPDKLFLALEPEVAAIFTQSEVKEPAAERLPPQRYMVVDIGGGTVDITVHDQREGKVDVILPPTGNMWGGHTVNEACKTLIESILKDTGFKRYLKQYPNDVSTINNLIYLEFEKEKKYFGRESRVDPGNSIAIALPNKLIRFYGETVIKKGAEAAGREVTFENDRLYITHAKIHEKVFQPTINHIVPCIIEALQELSSKVNTIYLVGGFGGCEFVYTALREALSKYKTCYDQIVRPHLPDLAVVKGAVMWRQDPSIIQSRKADATYGMCYSIPFIRGTHDVHYRKYDFTDRINRCTSVFKVFIEKGEMAGFNDLYTATGYPVNETDAVISVPIYSTSKVGVKYVKDKEGKWTVQEIGKLIIEVPNPRNIPNIDRIVDYTMSFSDTEIHARAKYRVNNNEVKIVCDFLSHQDKQTS